ncbi:MAG: TonB-dependent receptor domain-containing protein, partial [Bryobacteraceae bacterium]
TDAGLPGLNTGTPETSGMPAIYVNGSGGFNFGYALGINSCNCPLKETENHYQVVNNWTKQKGNHTIKWGVDIRRAQQQRIPSDSHRSGEIAFSPGETANPDVDNAAAGQASTGVAIASYLLGDPSSFSRYFTGPGLYPGIRQSRLFMFAQDSWRVTPKLTFTYGLRWEDYLPQKAAKIGGAGSFDPSTGEVLVAGYGTVPDTFGIKAYNLDFAPRIGISYQLFNKTVIRSGYGRSFNPSGLGSIFAQGPDYDPPITNPQNVSQNNPYVAPFNLLNGPPTIPAPVIGRDGRYPLPDGIGVNYYVDPLNSYRIPEADFWNFTVQQEITQTLAAEVAYVGNVGRHLYLDLNRNQAIPGPGSFDSRRPFYALYGLEQGILQTCNCDNSNYNSLQAKLQKRFSHGLDFLLTYTYSKALGNSEGAGGYDDNYNVRASYGPMSFDHTHALTLIHNWDLPFGKGRRWDFNGNRAMDLIAGGWRFSGVTTLLSGAAFTPNVSFAPLLNADFASVRPDIVGSPSVSNPNRNEWFSPAAYTAPQQPYRDGTASRGSLRGPAQYIANLALAKSFAITESKQLEFRWETFNAFNHVNLANPNSTIDVAGAGQITQTATQMRQMQFGLHFTF